MTVRLHPILSNPSEAARVSFMQTYGSDLEKTVGSGLEHNKRQGRLCVSHAPLTEAQLLSARMTALLRSLPATNWPEHSSTQDFSPDLPSGLENQFIGTGPR